MADPDPAHPELDPTELDPTTEALDPTEALASAVLEIESFVASQGWDQPSRLFALVETRTLMESDPDLARTAGLDPEARAGALTSVEQEHPAADQPLEDLLERIVWPEPVTGCVAVLERLVLPPEADAEIPEDPMEAGEFARTHPERQEVRLVAGVTRAGDTFCALRMRSHDEDESVVNGTDLVPGLLALLADTFDEEETQ